MILKYNILFLIRRGNRDTLGDSFLYFSMKIYLVIAC